MSTETSRFKKLQEQAEAFFDDAKLAMTGEARLTRLQKFVHFWMLVGRSFVRNRCPVRASALAYTTLLALIPLLAVGIGVTSSLLKAEGSEPVKELVDKLVEQVAPQLGLMPMDDTQSGADAKAEVAARIMEFVGRIHSGALGLTGTVALILVAIGLLSTIEATFNDIWGVERGRSWFARLVQYWAAITLGPLMMVLAVGLTIGGKVETAQRHIEQWLPVIGVPLIKFASYLAPFLILTATFMLLYMLMPNTRVHWKAALVGGLVGGLLWNLNSNFNVLFASKVVTQSKIYGPLGAVPVFLIGLYFSWLIMLFGAQVSYAFQNRRAYLQEKQADTVNERGREFVALRLMTFVGQQFQNGRSAPAATEIAAALDVPTRLIHRVAKLLVEAKLLAEVHGPEIAYAPARPLDKITCYDILLALRAAHGHELATRKEGARALVRGEFDRIEEAERQAASAVDLFTLVHRAEQQVELLAEGEQPPAKAVAAANP